MQQNGTPKACRFRLSIKSSESRAYRLSEKRSFSTVFSSCPFPSRTLPFSLQGSYSSCEQRTSCRTSSRYDARSAEPVHKSAAPFPGRAQAQTAPASPACDVPPPSRCHGRARPADRGRYPPHVLRSCSRRCLRGRHSRPAGAGARPEGRRKFAPACAAIAPPMAEVIWS